MNRFKKMIKKGEKPVGTFIESNSSMMVEISGYTGFDFVIIDNEHSPIDFETSTDMIRSCELSGLTPIARVKEMSRSSILKLLDVGAEGLIVPYVKTIEEVEQLVKWSKYKPIGDRGYSGSRKDIFGFKYDMSVSETMKYFNNEVLLIPQCETKEAYENIERIVNIKGVDGIFIGPYDLSISLGMPGDFENPMFKKAVKHIVDVTHKAKKFTMIYAGSVEKARNELKNGNDSVAYCMDTAIYINAAKQQVKSIKE